MAKKWFADKLFYVILISAGGPTCCLMSKNTGGILNMAKWVYLFSEGNASMRELLGGKGANLAEMTKIGLPVP